MGRPADAFAANDVAGNLHLTRRAPLFASLGLARQGAIHSPALSAHLALGDYSTAE